MSTDFTLLNECYDCYEIVRNHVLLNLKEMPLFQNTLQVNGNCDKSICGRHLRRVDIKDHESNTAIVYFHNRVIIYTQHRVKDWVKSCQ